METPRYDTFISYREADREVARAVRRLLTVFGHCVFLDDECLVVGGNWKNFIDETLKSCSTLIVLWSRNAANSTEMKREWQQAPAGCSVIPILLDGGALPPDLGALHAIKFRVADRIAARGVELMKGGHVSRAKANATILDELRKDGVELTAEQERAIGAYVGGLRKVFAAGAAALVTWLLTRGASAATLSSTTAAAAFATAWYVKPSPPAPAITATNPPVLVRNQENPAGDQSLQRCNDERTGLSTELEKTQAQFKACEAEQHANVQSACKALSTKNEALTSQLASAGKDLDTCQGALKDGRTQLASAGKDLDTCRASLKSCQAKPPPTHISTPASTVMTAGHVMPVTMVDPNASAIATAAPTAPPVLQ